MAGAWVQGRSIEQAGGTNIALAFITQNVTAGNAIVVGATQFGATMAAATCADGGDTFTRDNNEPSGGANVVIFSAPNVTGGSKPTVTVTVTGTNDKSITIAEFSGLIATALADKVAQNTGTASPFATGTTPATTQADEVAIWIGSHDGPTTATPTSGSGYTIPAANLQTSSVNMPIALGYKILSATGAQSDSITWTGAAAGWATVIATYKAAAATATSLPPPRQPMQHLLVR
jgi:hypothetical protein